MRYRLTITMMLTFGVLLSTTAAALAVSGVAGSGAASDVQYRQDVDGCRVLGETGQGGGDGEVTGETGQGGDGEVTGETGQGGGDREATGDTGSGTADDPAEVTGSGTGCPDEPRQLGDGLPFTGLLLVPVLFGAVALLVTGVVLRRHSDEHRVE